MTTTPWAIAVPRGEWVDTYPTTNGRIIQGIRLAALYVGFILALIVVILVWAGKGDADRLAKVPWDIIDGFLQLLAWFIGAMMAVAAAQFVGKRATGNPAVLKAESDAKIAEATVTPQPVGTPHPGTPKEIVAALETVRLKQLEPVPGVATAMKEAEQPQTGTVAAAHSFDPGA